MENIKKAQKRRKFKSGKLEDKTHKNINKHSNSIQYKSLNNQNDIPKISLIKLNNNQNIIEITREKTKFNNHSQNPTVLDEIKRNLSYNNSSIINKKLHIAYNHFSPNENRKIDKKHLFIHNKKNKSKNCIQNTSRDKNHENDLNENKSNKIINKLSFNISNNKNEKNSVQKRIDINLPNPKKKYKFFTSNSNTNITERGERETFQIREIPTMMLSNRIKLKESEDDNQNSETYNNFNLKSIYQNENYSKSKINPILKHKIFLVKTKCLNNKKLIKKDNNNNKNNINDFGINENLLKDRTNSDNKNLICLSIDSKQNQIINISNNININKNKNKKNKKSITSSSEIQISQNDIRSKNYQILLNKNNKKNMKMKIMFNKSKDFSNTEINNLIDMCNIYQEHNGILEINKTPKNIGKIEIEKKLKNDTQRQNKILFNLPNSNKDISYRYNYIALNNTKNKKLIEDGTEEVEEIETFDNSIQLYDRAPYRFNSKKIKYNNIIKKISTEHKIIENIIDFCDHRTLNKICLISKNFYNVIKIIIYEKIKNKILKYYQKKNIYKNNKIKNSVFKYSRLSEMSKTLLQKKYTDLLYENNCKYDEEIKKDLTRTLPDDYSFQYGNSNYNKLYHILTAYSNYNKKIGYAQGLNFLAANSIYAFENEIDEFIFLDALIRKFNLEVLLGVSNNLKIKLRDFNVFLRKYTPKVNSYLESITLNYDFFTANWMLTLFSSSMNIKYLFCLWDYMIIFGWKFFKCFVVAVIKKYENDILKQSQNYLTFYMKNILKDNKFKENFESIISLTFEYMIKVNEIIC